MAFLTSRIDNLNDKKLSYSARSLSSISYDSSHLSSRSYSSIANLRHIKFAGFIDNFPILDALSEDNEKYATMPESHAEDVPSLNIESEENPPTTRDNVKYATMFESQADLVPPLDIKSEENYPTTRDYTFSYRNHCEANKIALKSDEAFETWLSAKRKLLSDEAARRKREKEIKQKEIEERKRLAKEKYDGWLQKKSQSSLAQHSISNHTVKSNTSNDIQIQSKLSPEEVRDRLKEWEEAKRKQDDQRRALKRQEDQRRREQEEQRRQMAAEAWENWVANVNNKPKPVPLNRGIFTLRGTVSDIFVNPNEWKPIIPEKNE